MGGALSKPDPAATLQVVGAGYSRTGTSSLQLALAKLVDGPIYHGGTQIWMSGDDGMLPCPPARILHQNPFVKIVT